MSKLKNKKILLCVLVVIVILLLGYKIYEYINLQKLINTPINKLTNEQKLEDFEYLYNTIVENYPFLEVNKRKYGVDWEANKEKYIELIKQEPDFEVALNQILSELNNSHTNLTTKSFLEYATYIYQSIDETTLEELNLSKEEVNWNSIQSRLEVLNNPLVQARYGLDANTNPYFNTNSEVWENYTTNAQVRDIVEGKVASIYIPSMISYDALEEDRKIIIEYLNKVKNYQALVIDIRGNGGGNSSYWQAFLLPLILKESAEVKDYAFYKDGEIIKKELENSGETIFKVEDLDLSQLPNLPPEISEDFTYYTEGSLEILPDEENYIGFDGNIYLFVDGSVFSSSESLAVYAKEMGFATIIGEQTKGDGIGVGFEPLLTMLPNSGYVIRFTGGMGVTSDGTCNAEYGTTPDYIVPSAKYPDEYINLDKCVEKVLELEGIDTRELK